MDIRSTAQYNYDTDAVTIQTHLSRRMVEDMGLVDGRNYRANETISAGQVCTPQPCEPKRVYYITTRENEIVFSDSPPDWPKCQHEPPMQTAFEILASPDTIRKWADEAAANGLNVVRDW